MRSILNNKKGAEGGMSIGMIIAIVIGIIILVLIVMGLTGGWSTFWANISAYFTGTNVDSQINACKIACQTGNQYDYCQVKRTVVTADKTKLDPMNCQDLVDQSIGFERCPGMDCS